MYYTCEEVAAMLKVTRQSVWKWIKAGKLEAVQVGRGFRVPKKALDRFIKQVRPLPNKRS